MSLKDLILDMSRQARIAPLTPWFDHELDRQIQMGYFLNEDQLEQLAEDLTLKLREYSGRYRISTVVLGMSGGVDSALTAALFKRAGWTVIGVTMPIHQDEAETQRGVEACEALGIQHIHKDLSALYDATLDEFADVDAALNGRTAMMAVDEAAITAVKIRRGNVRARLRMITLYNLASKNGGLVASTDNFSELAAGFWTLHGDVGDLAPIQSLLKSWEVPMLAKLVGVPESTWRATPTDGLGISAGDEAQLGGTYLEWDLMVRAMHSNAWLLDGDDNIKSGFADKRANTVFDAVVNRMRRTHFKRNNPACLEHSMEDRYEILRNLDIALVR